MRSNWLKSLRLFSQLRNSFFAVIVLIQILLVTLSILFEQMTVSVLEKSQADSLRVIIQNVTNMIDAGTDGPKVAVATISKNQPLMAVLAQRDRAALLAAAGPIFDDLKRLGFKQFQFHVPEGASYVTLLRVHQPERFGEELSYRPMIIKSNTTTATLAGLEQGKSGYGFRVVSPAYYEGRHIGSFEVGYDFGKPFLEQLSRDFPGGWAIYNLSRGVQSIDDRILMATLGEDKDGDFKNLPLAPEILEQVYRGETHFERSRETNTATLYIPARNYRGDITLVLKYVFHTDYFSNIADIIRTAIVICLIGLALSGIIIFVLNHLISKPVRKLVVETEKIRNFRLEGDISFSSSLAEINELIDSMRSMKNGLQSFKKYVPAELVRQLIDTKQEAQVGGQRRDITVFFSDIEGFTSISESLTPNELTKRLSEYLSLMTDIIIKHNGTVDKYIGDSIMAFWGAPIEHKNHAELACRAAIDCQKVLAELNARWTSEGKEPFQTRMGINSGEIVVGNIGSTQRLSYTAIGDDVNLASRLESLNGAYGTRCIISASTAEQLPPDFALRLLDYVVVKGKIKAVMIYELVAEKGDVRSVDLEFLRTYNECVALYRRREWDEAIDTLQDLLKVKPNDKAARILLERCRAFKTSPPPDKWKGEFVYDSKKAA